MTIITIPKKARGEDLVIIPKSEYERLAGIKMPRVFKEVSLTKTQKRAFERAERNFAKGDFVNLDALKRDLEHRH